ncbi:MAG: hypothetical protein JJT89_16685 [Nitriliruptoraceae bacterium]|nr:hypothetical protein [Nitriliruptoraceae bacterium]
MGADDDTGWNEVLLELWSPRVRDDVVRRIEQATTGRHGWLVRVFAAPEGVAAGLTEVVHRVILAAIRDETGADLESLGSQAAWECYEQVWDRLAARWADGGSLGTAPIGREPDLVRAVRALPLEAAVAAGADGAASPPDPLWLHGRLRIDVIGLHAYLRLDGGQVPEAVQQPLQVILGQVPAPEPLPSPGDDDEEPDAGPEAPTGR